MADRMGLLAAYCAYLYSRVVGRSGLYVVGGMYRAAGPVARHCVVSSVRVAGFWAVLGEQGLSEGWSRSCVPVRTQLVISRGSRSGSRTCACLQSVVAVVAVVCWSECDVSSEWSVPLGLCARREGRKEEGTSLWMDAGVEGNIVTRGRGRWKWR